MANKAAHFLGIALTQRSTIPNLQLIQRIQDWRHCSKRSKLHPKLPWCDRCRHRCTWYSKCRRRNRPHSRQLCRFLPGLGTYYDWLSDHKCTDRHRCRRQWFVGRNSKRPRKKYKNLVSLVAMTAMPIAVSCLRCDSNTLEWGKWLSIRIGWKWWNVVRSCTYCLTTTSNTQNIGRWGWRRRPKCTNWYFSPQSRSPVYTAAWKNRGCV